MARMFNLPSQSFARLILGSEIELESFLEIILDVNKGVVHWPQMMALCLYTQFLLVSLSENCDSKILHVLSQVEVECNPFPLILVETLIRLDNFALTGWFSGSPMLLEVSLLLLPSCYAILSFLNCLFYQSLRCGFMRS